MKRLLFIAAIAIVAFSCKNNNENNPSADNTMTKNFKPISPDSIQENAIKLMKDDWMLITAGTLDSCNMMTASWGTIGFLWNEPVLICFVRPQRHTFGFMENNADFTVSVFAEEYRHILNYCGKKSGKDVNKIKETGLIPLTTERGSVYYEQARIVFECEKIYADFFKPEMFIDKELLTKIYPEKDYHKMYIGKIVSCRVAE